MSSLHPASLLHPSEHSLAMLEMLNLPINRSFVDYIVQCTVETVDYAMRRPSTSTVSSKSPKYSAFTEFAWNVICRSEIKISVLYVALVFIERAKPTLSIALEQWACERVFLGAVITAAKYTNDSSLKNVHWSMCTGCFGRRDVGRIEREFLEVINWDLSIRESDLLAHHNMILPLYAPASYPRFTSSKRPRSNTIDDLVSSWSESDDSSSCSSSSSSSYSSSASPSCSPLSPPLQPYFCRPHVTDERSSKRRRSDSSMHPKPSRPQAAMDASIPSALELLKSFPIPIPWSLPSSSTAPRCKPQPSHCIQPAGQIWL